MLSNLTYENSNMVLNRLVKKINESGFNDRVEVFGQLQSLDPIELEERHVFSLRRIKYRVIFRDSRSS